MIPPDDGDGGEGDNEGDNGDPENTSSQPGDEVPTVRAKDAANATAEVVCKAIYGGIGLITGQPGEATPSPAEHKALKTCTASFLSAKGWLLMGVGLFAGMWVLYLFGVGAKPNTLAWLKERFKKSPKNVTPVPIPEAKSPPPPPVSGEPTPFSGGANPFL